MSGPKVITIVSLEENIEICQVLLAQVDAEIAEWAHIGRRNSVISKADEAATQQCRASLARMLELGQHLSLQKEAPLLIQKLRSDIDQRLERAENSRVGTSRTIRSLQFTSAAVLRQAEAAALKLPANIANVLREACQGRCEEIDMMQQAISKGLELTKPKQNVSGELSAVSRQLASNAKADSLDDWMKRNLDLQESDKRFTDADKLICRIRMIDEDFSSHHYESRLQEIASDAAATNRSLLLDTICMELKALLTKFTQWAALRRRLGELHVEAEVSGELDVLQSLFAQFPGYQQSGNTAAANTLNENIQEALNQARVRKSGEKKRQALIQGLNEIGYVVNPEMSKVWTTQKQVVVRNQKDSSIGIELGGNLEAGRCQVRVVVIGGEAEACDSSKDKQHEEQWCSDLAKLQEKLASAGGSLRIEKATAAGVIPLKVVKGQWSADFEERTTEIEPVRVEQKRAN